MEKGKKFEVKECIRMTSVGCMTEPQANALFFLKNDDLRSFTDIINNIEVEANSGKRDHWINQPTDDAGATLLEIAIILEKKKFVETLVYAGARLDIVSQASGLAPPHLAAERGDLELLKLVYKDLDECDVNIKAAAFKRGYSPLHISAENGHTECVRYMLTFEETDVDSKDIKGDTTPLFLAIKYKHEPSIKLLIENGASLDVRAGGGSLKDVLKKTVPALDLDNLKVKKSRKLILGLKDKVHKLLKETENSDRDYIAKLGIFKTYMRFIRSLQDQQQLEEVFDLACDKGLHDHVELMLRKGANPNTSSKPILEAAFYGHSQVLSVLLNYNVNLEVTNATTETILHLILKKKSDSAKAEDYQKCMDVLFGRSSNGSITDQLKSIINKKDDRGNTALHYATQMWPQSIVRKLLDLGANIGTKNFWQEIPLSKIRPETLENFFTDSCMKHSEDVVHENFSITFKYDFLAPNVDCLPEKYRAQIEAPEDHEVLIKTDDITRKTNTHALPETEPLWYMSQSKDHRHLLKHPVITSFLWYKWQRIRKYFNRNIRFFSLFVFLLTWNIFNLFGGKSPDKKEKFWFYPLFLILATVMLFYIVKDWSLDIKDFRRRKLLENNENKKEKSLLLCCNIIMSNWIEMFFIGLLLFILVTGVAAVKIVLCVLLSFFILREIFQLFVSVKRYFSSFENWIEIGIIILTSILVFQSEEDSDFVKDINKHLSAINIVLSLAELVVLIGRHPKLKEFNIYVTMFLKVLKTFFMFISWYSLFIVAFGLGFFILLHKDQVESEDDYIFFNQVWLSLIKTTTMFVGELEFSDIPVDLDSKLAPLAYVFFLSFVFLIVVVLMNLLNGLAVSDTGLIREKAEIYSYTSQVETISTFESMLLGDPFDFLSNVPAMLSSFPSCSLFRQLYRNKSLRNVFTKIGASEILLFYKFFPNKSVTIYPNKYQETPSCLSVDEIGKSIVESAKKLIIEKRKDTSLTDGEIKEYIQAVESHIDKKMLRMEEHLGKLEDKLELILRNLQRH